MIVRVPLIILYFLLVGLIGSLLCLFRPFHPDNNRIFARIYSWGGRKILGIKIEREGLEFMNTPDPCVYVSNHQDNFDLFVCGYVIPKRAVSIGKKTLRYIPFFGQLYWLTGNLFIDRESAGSTKTVMGVSRKAMKEDNTSIWVFVEGTRNRGNNLLPFKKGAFRMAIDAGVPVVPVCTSSYAKHINLNKFRSVNVKIKFLPPISTKDLKMNNSSALMQECWTAMKKTIDELDQEIVDAADQKLKKTA